MNKFKALFSEYHHRSGCGLSDPLNIFGECRLTACFWLENLKNAMTVASAQISGVASGC